MGLTRVWEQGTCTVVKEKKIQDKGAPGEGAPLSCILRDVYT